MSLKTKVSLLSWLLTAVIFIVTLFALDYFFPSADTAIISGITAVLTVVLAPRERIMQHQSGEEIQLRWFFGKKIISIK